MTVYRCQYWLLEILTAEKEYLRVHPISSHLTYKATVVVDALTVKPKK
jgi:hypothetical protein